ncbi:hypothetical protein LSH36_696g01065 [Paralvinella palmiformis]|uniref:Uncharacterized protein n=1 Tax=Paralvinella palmiformis TaxID=53620 RepID=A0AAD9MVC2_9ANNE|nr:hypothetical protein LSH36_696g01065 [Paralvinella palmiformis]
MFRILETGGNNIKCKCLKTNVVKKHIRPEQYKETIFGKMSFSHEGLLLELSPIHIFDETGHYGEVIDSYETLPVATGTVVECRELIIRVPPEDVKKRRNNNSAARTGDQNILKSDVEKQMSKDDKAAQKEPSSAPPSDQYSLATGDDTPDVKTNQYSTISDGATKIKEASTLIRRDLPDTGSEMYDNSGYCSVENK